ncbi:MAG: tyrosine-type recombinase/integrase, partial [Coriobacteriales bacterium]
MNIRDKRFFECMREFLVVELPNSNTKSRDTQRTYRAGINLFLEYLDAKEGVPLAQAGFSNLNGESMMGFRAWMIGERGLAPETARLRMTAVRMLAEYASKKHLLDATSLVEVFGVKMPKCTRKLVTPMSEAATEAVLEAPDPSTRIGYRDRNIMIFLYDTAVRCSELVGLRVRDLVMVEGNEHVYVTGKGSKIRAVPIDLSAGHLRKYLAAFHPQEGADSERPLFYPVRGAVRHLEASTVEKMVAKHGRTARESCPEVPQKVYPHLLRYPNLDKIQTSLTHYLV